MIRSAIILGVLAATMVIALPLRAQEGDDFNKSIGSAVEGALRARGYTITPHVNAARASSTRLICRIICAPPIGKACTSPCTRQCSSTCNPY
jgi:hypothetical protein